MQDIHSGLRPATSGEILVPVVARHVVIHDTGAPFPKPDVANDDTFVSVRLLSQILRARYRPTMDRMARVLVVEDDPAARRLLCRWLTGWGYEVWEAVSADAAIEMMETTPADIIITDIVMPTHDGMWLLRHVHERWPSTVVIMESGAQNVETVLEARRFGAQDFLAKPFGRETLRQALERAATNERLGTPSHELGWTNPNTTEVDGRG